MYMRTHSFFGSVLVGDCSFSHLTRLCLGNGHGSCLCDNVFSTCCFSVDDWDL